MLENQFVLDLNAPIDSFAGLALSHQAMKHTGKANETIAHMLKFARQSNNAEHMGLADAARA